MFKATICAIAIVVILALAVPIHAQTASKIPRIGYISGRDASSPGPLLVAFRQGLQKLGYIEGKNLVIDYRFGAAENEAFRRAISELIDRQVDLLVVPLQLVTAKRLVKTTPIVMISNLDPVNSGLIHSLANPRGNITGVTTLSRGLTRKRLELFKELVPTINRLGILRNTDDLSNSLTHVADIQAIIRELGMNSHLLDVHSTQPDLAGAFDKAVKTKLDAILTLTPMLINHQKPIADLARQHRLPSAFAGSTWVEAGGLMSYSADEPLIYRRAASYVDKILKGAKPGELAVEEPSKFEFAVNRKTAQALRLTISDAILRRADRVIR